MKTLNIGLIGYGFIGKVHAHGYMNLPFYYEALPVRGRITHVCTGHRETAQRGCRQIGANVACTDYREVTENPDIDVVHICSPNHLHKDALLSAMSANKHIYCDKPLVANMKEAESVLAALPAYAGTSQMTLQNRFFPGVIRAKQLLDEGLLGQILGFRAAYLHGGSANPEAPLKWKLTSRAGGGVIADLGSHILDLVYHLLGDYRSLIACSRIAYTHRPLPGDPSRRAQVEAEDQVLFLARMTCGAEGSIEATKLAMGVEDELRIEIHGSKGALSFNSMEPHYLNFYDDCLPGSPSGGMKGWTRISIGHRFPEWTRASQFPGPKFSLGWLRVHAACLANFLRAIGDGHEGEPSLAHGVWIQYLMEQARHSAASDTWVDCLPANDFTNEYAPFA